MATWLQSANGSKGRKKKNQLYYTKRSPDSISTVRVWWCDRIPAAFVFGLGQEKVSWKETSVAKKMCSSLYIKISIVLLDFFFVLDDRIMFH